MQEKLGKHILIELYDCSEEKLCNVAYIESVMAKAAEIANATVVNSMFHHFPPLGVSGMVVIKESHLSIHTWPEYKYAAVDIFTCGENVNPWDAFDYLKVVLRAGDVLTMEISRGDQRLKHLNDGFSSKSILRNDRWVTERHNNVLYSLRHKGFPLFKKKSEYQIVEVYDTFEYGKTLVLDGAIMTSERDEFIYHEMISHIPVITHASPQNILVVGGGDGGVVVQLLKHKFINRITVVEIDEDVIKASIAHLPFWSDSLADKRVKLIIQDAAKYVKLTNDTYDTIIVDSTDPLGPSLSIFTSEFYKDIYRVLKNDGILVLQNGSSWYNPSVLRNTYLNLRKKFKTVSLFLAPIPTYPSGLWSFCLCAKHAIDPAKNYNYEYAKEFSERNKLHYYNEEIHRASFALPGFVKELLHNNFSINNHEK